jgi:hypothetical protein
MEKCPFIANNLFFTIILPLNDKTPNPVESETFQRKRNRLPAATMELLFNQETV